MTRSGKTIKTLPKQALTKKRKGAIFKYVRIRTPDHPTIEAYIEYTLRAERMNANKLYSYLLSRGYTWDSRRGYWREKKR